VADEILEGYRVVKTISTGQSSQVLEVVEVSSHRHFAMKILLPEKSNHSESRRMLFHEAEVGKELTHPNVIKINYTSRESKIPFFVMEYFPAGSLKDRILYKQHHAFLRENALSILKQAATAFAYMNSSGWVHRDIKPNNILINASGALAQRMQSDSFFARLFRFRKKMVQGTRSYMAPEQIRGESLDGRCDIYSFGATAYEVVAFRPPFRAPTQRDLLSKHLHEVPVSPQNFNPDVTDEFAKLVLSMLAKKKEARPQSFHEILKAFHNMRVYKGDPVKKES
jgi:serine/threonine protein kinase